MEMYTDTHLEYILDNAPREVVEDLGIVICEMSYWNYGDGAHLAGIDAIGNGAVEAHVHQWAYSTLLYDVE